MDIDAAQQDNGSQADIRSETLIDNILSRKHVSPATVEKLAFASAENVVVPILVFGG